MWLCAFVLPFKPSVTSSVTHSWYKAGEISLLPTATNTGDTKKCSVFSTTSQKIRYRGGSIAGRGKIKTMEDEVDMRGDERKDDNRIVMG